MILSFGTDLTLNVYNDCQEIPSTPGFRLCAKLSYPTDTCNLSLQVFADTSTNN